MQRSSSNNNNTIVAHPACASCKHQRKKCAEDCVLAPYFPATRTREFQAVHRVFGVSNVVKLVKTVREEDRKSVADSLVWEACCRQNDPILGPLGEYRRIQEELKLYKSQKQTQLLNQNHHNHNHNHQLGQQSLMFSNNHGWNVNGNSNYDNGIIVDPSSFIYPVNPNGNNYVLGLDKIRKQEKDLGCLVPLHSQPQQQLSVNQQQYYLSGHQFGSINGKTMDNSLWEAGQ
ncbi:LOB domain-containing protein 2 [Euphorbia lathyris]|uniref:LOB domain-containing protein 2 n=1 Tax=Euphorbia lathyris TaxID=212925 RepID=UPI0033144102